LTEEGRNPCKPLLPPPEQPSIRMGRSRITHHLFFNLVPSSLPFFRIADQ
jgi:hypothetical protein